MKIKDVFLCFLLAFTISCTTGTKKATVLKAPDIPTEWRYLDHESFSMRYPQQWELQHDVEGALFCLMSSPSSPDDTFRENVNLVTEDLLEDLPLDRYTMLTKNYLKQKFTITDEKKLDMDGQIFYHLILKGKDGIHAKQFYMVKGKKAYILTFAYQPTETASIQQAGELIMLSFKPK